MEDMLTKPEHSENENLNKASSVSRRTSPTAMRTKPMKRREV